MADTDGTAGGSGPIGERGGPFDQPSSPSGWNRSLTRIKVVGVGDAGCKCVLQMSRYEVPGVQYVMINTDVGRIDRPGNVARVVQIGQRQTGDSGGRRYSRVTELAVEESDDQLRSALRDADLVLVTAGMGGSTGTNAAPYVGTLAKEMGAFVLGMVTTPFSFEGSRRIGDAVAGVAHLRPCVDNLIVVHGDRLLKYLAEEAEVSGAFGKADEVLSQGMVGISELLNTPAELRVDFSDVRSILGYPGGVLMAVGSGRGPMGVVEAAQEAVDYPLLNLSIKGARGVLFTVKGGRELTPGKVEAANVLIANALGTKARVLFGMSVDSGMEDRVQLTLIAAGL